jgi:formylglycine-generating enzyme required for sulfatase activity
LYPWGDDEDIKKSANTSESGIGRTTPVWMYPQGHSPVGIMDMSGNVWEWQANYSDKDQDVLGLRGGSWDGNLDAARVAFRDGSHPDHLWHYYGFRLVAVVSPPK